jgi:CDP-diacylglycerol--glycerol-3-phosphate 3-phosphatidyltransferase
MTTANKVTVIRILLIPAFVIEMICYVRTGNEGFRLAGLLSFAIASILDGVDGYIARHYNQRSKLGAILDPLADKLLLVSAIVFLNFNHALYFRQIPLWLTGIVVGRDLLLGIGVAAVRLAAGQVIVRPHLTGKLATIFQMLAVAWILLKWDFNYGLLEIWILGAGILTAVSAMFYFWDAMQQLGANPAGSPPAKK